MLWLLNSVDHDFLFVMYNGLYYTANSYIYFTDTFLLRVTDSNGTTIASTQVALYKCGAATKYVFIVLFNKVVIISIGDMVELVAKRVDI